MCAKIAARPSSGPATCDVIATSMRAIGPSVVCSALVASARLGSSHITTAFTLASVHISVPRAGCASLKPILFGAITNANTQSLWGCQCACAPQTQDPNRCGMMMRVCLFQKGCRKRVLKERRLLGLYPPPLLPCLGLQQGVQLVLGQGKEAKTPLILVVFLSRKAVESRDLNRWVLMPSSTFLRTDRLWEAWAVEINPCLLTSSVCSVMVPVPFNVPLLPSLTAVCVIGEKPFHISP